LPAARWRQAASCGGMHPAAARTRRFFALFNGSPTQVPDREDILAVVRIVNAYREEGVAYLGSALEDLQAPLKKAVGQNLHRGRYAGCL